MLYFYPFFGNAVLLSLLLDKAGDAVLYPFLWKRRSVFLSFGNAVLYSLFPAEAGNAVLYSLSSGTLFLTLSLERRSLSPFPEPRCPAPAGRCGRAQGARGRAAANGARRRRKGAGRGPASAPRFPPTRARALCARAGGRAAPPPQPVPFAFPFPSLPMAAWFNLRAEEDEAEDEAHLWKYDSTWEGEEDEDEEEDGGGGEPEDAAEQGGARGCRHSQVRVGGAGTERSPRG